MATLKRILRLWRVYGYIDFMMLTRDLKTFLIWVVSDTVLNIAGVTGMILLAAKFDGIGVWSRWQILFLLGYAMTVSGLIDVFFSGNIAYISRRIGRGQLDHVLAQPQPIWMSLLTEGFIPFSGGIIVLPGIALLTWATGKVGVAVTAGWIFFLCLNLLSSVLIVLAFSFLWGSLAFWSPRAAEEICSPIHALLNQMRVYPLDRMNRVLTSSLMTLLPVGFVAWYPCRALLGMDPTRWGHLGTLAAGLAFTAPALWIFRRGLKHYERTGSQRYLNYGHRR
jgi:ABC-2 type transport system permease protein